LKKYEHELCCVVIHNCKHSRFVLRVSNQVNLKQHPAIPNGPFTRRHLVRSSFALTKSYQIGPMPCNSQRKAISHPKAKIPFGPQGMFLVKTLSGSNEYFMQKYLVRIPFTYRLNMQCNGGGGSPCPSVVPVGS
jgi:hypothetical protein